MRRAAYLHLLPLAAASLALTACGPAENGGETDGESASESRGETATAASAAPAAFAQCSVCHSVEPGQNSIGPSLAGVFGAKAGHVGDFAYSPAMRESGLKWDEATLDTYLKAPRELAPGTIMSYAGLRDDAARAELIEWLKGV